jgi:hypothetical protein
VTARYVPASASARRRGFAATALAAAQAWLVEPAEPALEDSSPPAASSRPVVAVFGLARGCGATTVARGLAAELAARDRGSAAVSSERAPAGIPLAAPAASRLARTLADVPGARTRAVGRLCLVECQDQLALADTARHHAPLVLDAGGAELGGVPASLADHVVLVATTAHEPSLAAVASACLSRVGPEPMVVLNRAAEADGWAGTAALELPPSRLGASLALAGREPRGELGRAICALADLCGEVR